MVTGSLDLIRGRDAAGRVLEQLGLEAYLFEVEPAGEQWLMVLECAAPGGWHRLRFPVPRDLLLSSLDDDAAFSDLLQEWGRQTAQCRIG